MTSDERAVDWGSVLRIHYKHGNACPELDGVTYGGTPWESTGSLEGGEG